MLKFKSRKFSSIIVAFLLIGMFTMVTGCSSNPPVTSEDTQKTEDIQSKEPIKIGFMGPLSGMMSSLGLSGQEGIQTWAEMTNENGGLLGRPVEIISYDSTAKVDVATENMNRAVDEDAIDFMITSDTSGNVLATTPLAGKLQLLTMHTQGGAEEFSDIVTRHAFRVCDSVRVFAYTAAKKAAENKEITKWAGINPDYAWGHDSWKIFKEYLTAMRPDVEIVEEIFTPLMEKDFAPHISKLKASGAQGIHTSLWSGDLVTFIPQAKEYGLTDQLKVFIDQSTTNTSVAKALGDNMIETIGIQMYYFEWPDSEINKAFVAKYQELYGKDRVPASEAGNVFIACNLLEEAVKKANTIETMKVIESLENLEIESVSGPVKMREWDHQAVKKFVPTGLTAPDDRFGHWTWGEVFPVETSEKEIAQEKYKGWRGNQ